MKMDNETTTQTEQQTEPLGNAEEARNADGSLKNTQEQPQQTQTEDKTQEKTEDKAQQGAPEKYADFKAPDGYELNSELVEKAVPIFKELGLSQDAAQKLVDFYADAATKAEEAPYEAYEAMRETWRKEVIADKDIGNGTDDLKPEVKATIAKAIDALPPTEAEAFRKAMSETGAGDNPAIVKAFYNFAKKLGEGTLVTGTGPSPGGQNRQGQPQSAAQALYPNLPSSSR